MKLVSLQAERDKKADKVTPHTLAQDLWNLVQGGKVKKTVTVVQMDNGNDVVIAWSGDTLESMGLLLVAQETIRQEIIEE